MATIKLSSFGITSIKMPAIKDMSGMMLKCTFIVSFVCLKSWMKGNRSQRTGAPVVLRLEEPL